MGLLLCPCHQLCLHGLKQSVGVSPSEEKMSFASFCQPERARNREKIRTDGVILDLAHWVLVMIYYVTKAVCIYNRPVFPGTDFVSLAEKTSIPHPNFGGGGGLGHLAELTIMKNTNQTTKFLSTSV